MLCKSCNKLKSQSAIVEGLKQAFLMESNPLIGKSKGNCSDFLHNPKPIEFNRKPLPLTSVGIAPDPL